LNQQLARDIAARSEAESALRQQSALQQLMLDNIGDGVVVIDPRRKALVINPAAQQILPFVSGEILPPDWLARSRAYLADGVTLFPPERGPLARALQGQASDAVEMVFRVPSGELRSYGVTTRPIAIDGQVLAAVAVFRDSTERKTAARELLESEQRYRVLADASFEGVAITKAGMILDTKENFARWLGYEPRELAGRAGIELFSPEYRDRVMQASTNAEIAYEAEMLRRDGTTFPVEVRGRFLQFRDERVRIAVVRDIAEKKQREAELQALSLRDALTGLYNRRGFLELVGHQLKAAERKRQHCALFYADLDGMKQINDQLGHAMGDQALRSTAELLQRVFRASDITSRLGGDEFAIFAPDCDEEGVASSCARLARAVEELEQSGLCSYRLSISVGAAVWDPERPSDLTALIEAADRRMYEQKRSARQRRSARARLG
jgi:diguanylate cyclase (GGDEF)-like protein/PAS domain S-box-containing protein